jgi:catechol 2,3-dioxygenase
MTGTSRQEIFGGAGGAESASPGSYGQRPASHRLPDATRLGRVALQVADLDRSLPWYERTLGLRPLDREGRRALLGDHGDGMPLVELVEKKGAAPAPRRGKLGLFHFAILLPERAALGAFVRHLADIDAHIGAADHLVSEAVYLQDPDNLGIEVYADRPRDQWRRSGRQLLMATDPLDVPGLLHEAEGRPWDGMPAGTTMGHVHLHVGDIAQAAAFYSDALGLDRTVWDYPGALFMSAGGYHHHLGTNTWAGHGATAPSVDDAQLLEWTVDLPDADAVRAAAESLQHAGHTVSPDEAARSFVVRDPWGTPLRVRSLPI